MAPPKGETTDQKAARLTRRAAELAVKGKLARVISCLKERLDLVPDIERVLIARGALTADWPPGIPDLVPEGNSDVKVRYSKSEEKDDGDEQSPQPGQCGIAAPVGMPPPSSMTWLNKNITTYGAAPATLIMESLNLAEPGIFSMGNMKQLVWSIVALANLCNCTSSFSSHEQSKTKEHS